MKEKILHAAVKTTCGNIMLGKDHGSASMKALNIGWELSSGSEHQGFVTDKGRFVNRSEGGKLALESGQISKETDFLFSEDLWCFEYNGKHQYDYIEGYYEDNRN